MWFLTCDGESVFDNKRIWLRPGTQFMLGRTHPKAGSPGFYLEHPSASRKHLLLAVENVKPGDGSKLHVKSRLIITDNSKIGTFVDGDKLSKDSRTLDKTEHTLKLGNYPDLFRIKWVPTTLSITSLSKSAKKSEDPLAAYRAVLEPLDIKCIGEYITQYTSHIVTIKRNTSAVLQALVNGRYIVTEPFTHAITVVGKKDSPDQQSLLEVDFDSNWPRELDYLPPPGKEPFPRPEHSEQFLPNEARAEMFGKYTFVFNDHSQYDSLMAVFTGAGGKALVRQVNPGETDVSDMVEYVREVAGKKGVTDFDLTQQVLDKGKTMGGIILIRIGNHRDTLPGYYAELDRRLGQRSMEQNELLDVILDANADKLKKEAEVVQEVQQQRVGTEPSASADRTEAPREQDDSVRRAAEDTPMLSREEQSPQQQRESRKSMDPPQSIKAAREPSAIPLAERRAARQRTTQPRYQGFSSFAPEEVMQKFNPASPSQSPVPEIRGQSQAPVEDESDHMDVEHPNPSQSQAGLGTQRSATQRSQAPLGGRKRRGEPLHDERERESTKSVVDGILQGATAMKKRRLEEAERQKANRAIAGGEDDDEMHDENVPPLEPAPAIKKHVPKKKGKGKEMDVMALVTAAKEKEEEARARDEENLRLALDGLDVADIRNLAQVEEMEVLPRAPRTRATDPDDGPSDRWDDRWNGRKNFKKFRKQRQPTGEVGAGSFGSSFGAAGYERARTRVIVPLEEVPKKGYGVGEDYWLESVEDTRRKEKQKRQSQKEKRQSFQSPTSTTTASAPAGAGTTQSQSQRNATQTTRMRQVNDNDSDNNDDDDDARFRRRIRASRAEDAEAAEAEELLPEEIAGRARDEALTRTAKANASAAASSSSTSRRNNGASTTTQTQTQTQCSSRDDVSVSASALGSTKRKAGPEPSGQSAAKRARGGASVSASASASVSAGGGRGRGRGNRARTPPDQDEEEEESDEEDALRFRRRKR